MFEEVKDLQLKELVLLKELRRINNHIAHLRGKQKAILYITFDEEPAREVRA